MRSSRSSISITPIDKASRPKSASGTIKVKRLSRSASFHPIDLTTQVIEIENQPDSIMDQQARNDIQQLAQQVEAIANQVQQLQPPNVNVVQQHDTQLLATMTTTMNNMMTLITNMSNNQNHNVNPQANVITQAVQAALQPAAPNYEGMLDTIRAGYKEKRHISARDKHEIETLLTTAAAIAAQAQANQQIDAALEATTKRNTMMYYYVVQYGWATAINMMREIDIKQNHVPVPITVPASVNSYRHYSQRSSRGRQGYRNYNNRQGRGGKSSK